MTEDAEKFPKERRRAPRVTGALVEYSIEGRDVDRRNAFIKDVCIYGICIYIPETVKSGEVISLDIILYGDDNAIQAVGKVIWCKPGGYLGYYNVGIEFDEISDSHQKILSDYIAANYRGE